MTTGRIEVICGSMYSGKSRELLHRMRRAVIAKKEIQLFKPQIDNRYTATKITSHNKTEMDANLVEMAEEVLLDIKKTTEVVGIDEGQFLGPKLPEVCEDLANRGIRVIVSGLDQDFSGRPFEPMPELMAIADEVLKLTAVCMACGGVATKTYRKSASQDKISVGGVEQYEARCRRCHQKR